MKKITRFEFTPVLGWSVSRFDKFKACKRQYFYDYYGKHDTEFSKYKIEELKKMTSVPLERGNIVHDVIKALLMRFKKFEGPIDKKRFYDYSRNITQSYCSKKIFQEIYYEEKKNIDIEAIYQGVQSSLDNFIQSPRYEFLKQKALASKENWVIEPPGYGETRIGERKAYCKVDFLFPVNNILYILDWKTGKEHDKKHKNQLIGYSAWASYHYSKDPAEIIPIIIYLNPVYKEMEITVLKHDIDEFSQKVQKETDEMYTFLNNVEENIPKEKEVFEKTANRKICSYCNYKELCWMIGL